MVYNTIQGLDLSVWLWVLYIVIPANLTLIMQESPPHIYSDVY